MQTLVTNMTVAEYCKGLSDKSIVVNHDYQRSNKVWPTTAQSFLIESILLGYPVPKLALYQITDRNTRSTIKEIVDGQQRTEAIRLFAENKLRLSSTLEFEEAAGRRYDDLSEELQDRFLSYGLGFDLFIDSTPRDIRETFRRVNAYETPLNGEEQRFARYQGSFKWFIYKLSSNHDESFKALGSFGERQLARMTDMKLLSEVVNALEYGITTTNKKSLDQLYEAFDDSFKNEAMYADWVDAAFLTLIDLEELHGTSIMKPYSLYSLLLALIHAEHSVPTLNGILPGGGGLAVREELVRNLSQLVSVMDLDKNEVPGEYLPFYLASEKGTNVKAARETRFKYFFEAVSTSSVDG